MANSSISLDDKPVVNLSDQTVSTNNGYVIGAIYGNVCINQFASPEQTNQLSNTKFEKGQCPYRGLKTFQAEHAKFFFGREEFTEYLFNAVQKQSFLPIVGPSGSGKSSVVLAGLVPKLQSANGYKFFGFRPGSQPFETLAELLAPLVQSQGTNSLSTSDLTNALKQDTDTLRNYINGFIRKSDTLKRLVIIIDQFEELFTPYSLEQQQFIDSLIALKDVPKLTLALTMRADFYGQALSHRPLSDVFQNTVQNLGPLTLDELKRAIEEPAKVMGMTLEEGLTSRIIEELSQQPGQLPLLQFALTLLWDRQNGSMLTHKAYEEIGGAKQALAEYAEDVYARKLDEKERKQAQQFFIQLVHINETTEVATRKTVTREQIKSENWPLVKKLADERLVVIHQGTKGKGEDVVEIVHEALIREWGTLDKWLKANKEFRLWQERLQVRLHEWEKSKSKASEAGLLLEGNPLVEAEDWQKKHCNDLSDRENSFIGASLKLRKYQTIRKITLAIIASLSLLSVGGGVFWNQQRTEARIGNILVSDSEKRIDAPGKELTRLLDRGDKNLKRGENSEALPFYRKIITEALKPSEGNNSSEEETAIKDLKEQAESRISAIVHEDYIPLLEKYLGSDPQVIGEWVTSEIDRSDGADIFTEGALKTTYAILVDDTGFKADINDDGDIRTVSEAERMPCESLREIERIWREATEQKCGFYGEDFYTASDCKQLNTGTIVTELFFGFPDLAIDQLKHCDIKP
ncbi:MAG: ATP-binding protein [Leptolyngbya sp. SIO3F4]|nr:ATP-binding protein [Leptolyngbya sp. SIO3F4]